MSFKMLLRQSRIRVVPIYYIILYIILQKQKLRPIEVVIELLNFVGNFIVST